MLSIIGEVMSILFCGVAIMVALMPVQTATLLMRLFVKVRNDWGQVDEYDLNEDLIYNKSYKGY